MSHRSHIPPRFTLRAIVVAVVATAVNYAICTAGMRNSTTLPISTDWRLPVCVLLIGVISASVLPLMVAVIERPGMLSMLFTVAGTAIWLLNVVVFLLAMR